MLKKTAAQFNREIVLDRSGRAKVKSSSSTRKPAKRTSR